MGHYLAVQLNEYIKYTSLNQMHFSLLSVQVRMPWLTDEELKYSAE